MTQKDNITVTLQPTGIALAWISLALIGLGLFSVGPSLFLGLCGILLLPICKWLARAQLSGLSFTRELPCRVFSGECFAMEVMVQNRSRHFSASHLMVFPAMADASSKSVPLPFLEKRASLETSWTGRLFKRGWNDQKQVFVTSTWPLGVFEARLVSSFSDTHSSELDGILVVPRPLTPDFLLNTIRLLEEKGQMTTGIEADAPTEFRYLREFRPGDSVKNIHWPSSTRAGQFFIKETDPPIPQPLEYGLLLHSFSPAGAVIRNDRFETMLRIAAGLVVFFQKQNTPIVFSAAFSNKGLQRIPAEAGYATVLDQIARASLHSNADAPAALADLARMNSCDQVFVLGMSEKSSWEKEALNLNSSCVCIDTEKSPIAAKEEKSLPRRKLITS